jgi:hypothetical protein
MGLNEIWFESVDGIQVVQWSRLRFETSCDDSCGSSVSIKVLLILTCQGGFSFKQLVTFPQWKVSFAIYAFINIFKLYSLYILTLLTMLLAKEYRFTTIYYVLFY